MAAELANSLTVTEARRLEQAEAEVRRFCGWHIAPEREDVVLTLNGTGSSILPLPSLHVTGVTSIVEDGVEVDLATVDWSESGWIEKRCGTWCRKPRSVVVTLSHGHSPIPPDVEGAVIALAQVMIDTNGSVARIQDGPFSESYRETAAIAASLSAYRIL